MAKGKEKGRAFRDFREALGLDGFWAEWVEDTRSGFAGVKRGMRQAWAWLRGGGWLTVLWWGVFSLPWLLVVSGVVVSGASPVAVAGAGVLVGALLPIWPVWVAPRETVRGLRFGGGWLPVVVAYVLGVAGSALIVWALFRDGVAGWLFALGSVAAGALSLFLGGLVLVLVSLVFPVVGRWAFGPDEEDGDQ